jgi:hypothetical protein
MRSPFRRGCHDARDQFAELVRPERLLQNRPREVRSPVNRHIRSHEDHGKLGLAPRQYPRQFLAAAARHMKIGNHSVREDPESFQDHDRRRTIGCGADVVGPLGERARQRQPHDRIIIDQQNEWATG